MRAEVALGEEATDEEVVEAVVGGEVVYTFTMEEWWELCKTRGARSKVLRLAEEEGELAVRRFMGELMTVSCLRRRPVCA